MPPSTSRAPAATDVGDQRVDAVALVLVDDRAERDLVAGRVADRQLPRMSGQALDVPVGDAAGDEVAAGRHADLALVVERAERADRDRLLDVHVVQDDERRVAAQLEVDPLEVRRGQAGRRSARPGSSR